MRALGLLLIVPFMLMCLALMVRAAQRNLEVDLRDGRMTHRAKARSN